MRVARAIWPTTTAQAQQPPFSIVLLLLYLLLLPTVYARPSTDPAGSIRAEHSGGSHTTPPPFSSIEPVVTSDDQRRSPSHKLEYNVAGKEAGSGGEQSAGQEEHDDDDEGVGMRTGNNNGSQTENTSEGESDFRQESRRAFQQLRTRIEPPLLPEEERRQIWLNSHRRRPGRRRGGGATNHQPLTTADVVMRNQSCTGDLFKHKIRMAGCEPKIIINRFCHGSCSSFYIPNLRSKKLKASFQSCAACVPSETDMIEVRLNCPEREERELVRTVMRVKKCACRNIDLGDIDDDDEDDYDDTEPDETNPTGEEESSTPPPAEGSATLQPRGVRS